MILRSRLTYVLRLLFMLVGLFFLGYYSGVVIIKPVLHIVFLSLIFGLVPFLFIILLPAIGIYIIVNVFINYYYKDIDYNIRLLLLSAGLVTFYGGILLAL